MVARQTAPRRNGPVRTRRQAGLSAPEQASVPIEEIYPLYRGEWVLVKVTGLDRERGITHGQVLAHSRRRRTVSNALVRAHQQHPGIHTYLFPGGMPPPVTVEVQPACQPGSHADTLQLPP